MAPHWSALVLWEPGSGIRREGGGGPSGTRSGGGVGILR